MFLPGLHALFGACGLALNVAALFGLGALLPSAPPETMLVSGWGVFCIALTLWGVFLPYDLRIPLAALCAAGSVGLVFYLARARHQAGTHAANTNEWSAVRRVMLLTLPLWALMLGARPSEIDTWWNLLPNAAYLFDHNSLPTQAGPETYSFLPLAPYNTQFVAFGASNLSGGFAEGAMALFNVLLVCAASVLIARVAAFGQRADFSRPVPWWACALGCLIAAPLNPSFVPRLFFSSYGETGLAVTALLAVWLAVDVLDDMAHGLAARRTPALAMVLAAMVDVKQSGIGLVLPVVASAAALAWLHPGIPFRRAIPTLVAGAAPAVALYFIWHWFVLKSFPDGELQVMAMNRWNWRELPQIVGAVLRTMVQKPPLFVVIVGVAGLAWWRWRRQRLWDRDTLLLGMAAGVSALFVLFLIFTYVAHFDATTAAEAHSFFRYASQVSLVAMLALTAGLRPFVAAALAGRTARFRQRLGVTLSGVMLALPVAAATPLRFDLDAPEPTIWTLAREIAAREHSDMRLALLLPGDLNDSVGSMMRGVLMFVPPRLHRLDFTTRLRADPSALADVAAAGYDTAFVSCTPPSLDSVPGLEGLPPGVAALMHHTASGWSVDQLWRYPASLAGQRFSALLDRAPLCAGPIQNVPPTVGWRPKGQHA